MLLERQRKRSAKWQCMSMYDLKNKTFYFSFLRKQILIQLQLQNSVLFLKLISKEDEEKKRKTNQTSKTQQKQNHKTSKRMCRICVTQTFLCTWKPGGIPLKHICLNWMSDFGIWDENPVLSSTLQNCTILWQ